MSESRLHPVRWIVPILAVLLIPALSTPARAGFDTKKSVSANHLTLRNLIGEVSVVGHSGRDFEIEVSVQGSDADEDSVQIDFQEGSTATLNVLFPIDQSKNFVYPKMGSGTTTFSLDGKNGDSSWLSKFLGGSSNKRIKVTGRGSGLEIWADVTVRVPAGSSVEILHGVGDITAQGVDADIELDSSSGSVTIGNINGRLGVDVGSGAVVAENVRGDKILIDTGSGSVELNDCAGKDVTVDTGSGRVQIDNVEADKLSVDTGSGSVKLKRVAAESVSVDTGSGAVTLELDRMGTGRFEIDTGSGGVDLRLPPDASAEIRAETGSGGIDLDLDGSGAEVHHIEEDSVSISVGGGEARVNLDTGSGSIRVRY
jgi:DUF4097 and DUF4098 domain-containing protein YvlB